VVLEEGQPLENGRSALSALIPLALARHLWNASSVALLFGLSPQLDILDVLTRSSLTDAPGPDLRARALTEGDDMLEAQGIPELQDRKPSKARRFRADLLGKDERLFARLDVPWKDGAEHYGFWALVALIECACRSQPRETVIPAMTAVGEVTHLFRATEESQDFWDEPGLDLEVMAEAQEIALEVALAEDPLAVARGVRSRQAPRTG